MSFPLRTALHLITFLLVITILISSCKTTAKVISFGLPWVSPNHHRILLQLQDTGAAGAGSPASLELDFNKNFQEAGNTGKLDKHTVEVVAYDRSGKPVVYDSSASGYEKYLLPSRIDTYYGMDKVTLNFITQDKDYQYMVYFDTEASGLGKPERYHGLIGDGDRFTEGYKRREVNASGYDCFADLDNDGDLDLFKGGTEPYIHCYENVGKSRFISRGKLTSGGKVFLVPHDALNRSWHSVSFFDWDKDGDQDLFLFQPTGPSIDYVSQVSKYENTTVPGGQLTFTYRGKLTTASGKTLGSTVRFADYDGDGKTEVFSNRGEGIIAVYKDISNSKTVEDMRIGDGEYLQANGTVLHIWNATPDFADIDSDGDLDLFS